MLKVKKEKVLASLIAIIMVALVIGNVYSLATEGNTTSGGAITLTQPTNNSSSTNKASNNATGNTDIDVGAEVGATNRTGNNTNSNTNTNTSTNTNSSNTNSSRYNNTNSTSSKLPYAGSNTSIIFIVIALVASAVYAYKKVSDYNV